MDNNLLIKLQHFFAADVKLKKEMYNMVPPGNEGYLDKNSICEYNNYLNDSLIYIFSELKCITNDIFVNNPIIINKILELENKTKKEFYKCGLDIKKLRDFYKNMISNMSIDFINSVKQNCIGYTGRNLIPVEKISTINEALHFIHSVILNSEDILQALPLQNSKNNNYNYPISLRGDNSIIFKKLYDLFPLDLDCGWTDMIVINEKKLLMMIRDRGHALTIEITLNNDKAKLEYFIPKICNVEMVNNLPGVNKIKDHSIGTTGLIETNISDLPNTLYNFISKVPMDENIETFKNMY